MTALSAIPTLTQVARTQFGNKNVVCWSFSMDGSKTWPASGGLSLTPAQLGLSTLDQIFISPGTTGLLYSYDYTNYVLHAYTSASSTGATAVLVEANASTPASGTVSIMAIGKGVN
jgi:hypothetical protein